MGGAGPIPLTELQAYFHLQGILDPDDRDDYLYHIIALDTIYLEHVTKKD